MEVDYEFVQVTSSSKKKEAFTIVYFANAITNIS